MQTNALPMYDMSDNPTDCCPRFNPSSWDHRHLHFANKRFVKATTRSLFHIPINMARVFERTFKAIEDAGAHSDADFVVLSRELSPWSAEHYFAVTRDVPGEEMTSLSGDYLTRVFEGPFRDMPRWCEQAEAAVKAEGKKTRQTYFFYTTCPKCARFYGKNYVVAVSDTIPAAA